MSRIDSNLDLETVGEIDTAGDGNAGEIIGFMDDKVKRALEPLKECIERIEKENPDQFS